MRDSITAGLHLHQPEDNKRYDALSKILRSAARLKTITKLGGPENLIDAEISILKKRIEEWQNIHDMEL